MEHLSISEVLRQAQQRAREKGVPYEGLLLPTEAFFLAQHAPGARMVDVRTRAELDWVGRVPGALEIEWLHYPGKQLNPNFLHDLAAQADRESLLMFICRSGGRSHHAAAAAAQAGFPDCYNVLEGFEGDKDPQHHRNTVGGWRKAGLPWYQG